MPSCAQSTDGDERPCPRSNYGDIVPGVLSPAIDIFQLVNVDRIGLRYISQISIPSEDAERRYKQYCESPINNEAFARHVPKNS